MYQKINRTAGMRPSSPAISRRGKCSCGKPITGDGECTECRKKREGRLAAVNQLFDYNFKNFSVHADSRKGGMLSDTGEENTPADTEAGITRKADIDKQTPVGNTPPPEPVPAQATPSCSFSIGYTNIKKPGCNPGDCGATIVYDVTSVTSSGSACPAKLEGLRVTEQVTTDNGCGPGTVDTGGGCAIQSGGKVAACTDTYSMCGPAAASPAAGCTEKYTQKLFVGGVLAETRTLTFQISKPKEGGCSGTVTRT